MKSILFVDDDPEIILSTRRLLYTLHRDWQVTYANSAAEALAKFNERRYDVIVSDIRMPGMSGIDLLEQVRQRYPHTVRIALSGHSDRDASLKVSGLAHQYLVKPSSVETIIAAIERALTTGGMVMDENIRKILGQLKTIPSQPEVYLQIVEELKKPETSTGQVGRIISRDASMSAKVLQLVNSAFFGLPHTVSDPVQATALLGVETIRDLILGVGIFSQFDTRKLQRLSLANLWNHSQRTSGLAKIIAANLHADKKQINNAFVAGMLHDVGKLVLADNLPQQYQEVIQRWVSGNQSITKVEQQVFGTTHAQVGAYLFSLWGLPDSLVSAVAGHHEPASAPEGDQPVLLSVHAANVVDYQQHKDANKTGPAPQFDLAFLTACGVSDQIDIWRSIVLEKEERK